MRKLGIRLASATVAAAVGLGTAGDAQAQADAAAKADELVKAAAPAEDRELEVGKWYPNLTMGMTVNQTQATDNWNGGDVSSWSWVAFLYGAAENQLSPKVNSFNELKLAYGQTAKQVKRDDGTRRWESPEKTQDQIFAESVLQFTLGMIVDPYFSAGFSSQFLDASDGAGRRLPLNPVLFWQEAGLARHLINKEKAQLKTRMGFSFREFSRRQFSMPFPNETTTSESGVDGGISWTSDLNTRLLNDRVAWTSKLTVYQTAFWSGKDDLEGAGDGLAAAGIDRDASAVLDEAGMLQNAGDIRTGIRKAGQLKESLGIGISYSFF